MDNETDDKNHASAAFFKNSLQDLEFFLKKEYFPKVNQFKFESSIFKFESPLNFLMIKSDFREFLRSFYQISSLLQYSLKFHIDSMFSVKQIEDDIDPMKKKQELSYFMLGSVFNDIYACIDILKEYNHLVEHDSHDCYREYSFDCFFRKYGASIVTLTGLLALAWWRFQVLLNQFVKV